MVAETSDEIELIAAVGMPEHVASELCQKALHQSGSNLLGTAPWKYTLGIQIVLDDYPLGGFVLARDDKAFSKGDPDRNCSGGEPTQLGNHAGTDDVEVRATQP